MKRRSAMGGLLALMVLACGRAEGPCPEVTILPSEPLAVASATILELPLQVPPEWGRLLLCNRPLFCPASSVQVRAEPPVDLRVSIAADGGALHLVPVDLLPAGASLQLTVESDVYAAGPFGWAGATVTRLRQTLQLQVAPSAGALPLALGTDRVGAFEWSNWAFPAADPGLAANLAPREWIVGVIEKQAGAKGADGMLALWAIAATRVPGGELRPEAAGTAQALAGRFRGDAFVFSGELPTADGTGSFPFRRFELRGRLGRDLRVMQATTLAVVPSGLPTWLAAGLQPSLPEPLLSGTYETRAYGERGSANRRPRGLKVRGLRYLAPTEAAAGHAIAELEVEAGQSYPAAEHRGGVVLLDPVRHVPVALDYQAGLRQEADAQGNLRQIRLDLPAGSRVPDTIDLVVLADVFPLHYETLTTRSY